MYNSLRMLVFVTIFTINHFYYPTNALNYIRLRDENLRCVSFKRQLKITPTCFGSCAIHHQGILSCSWLKLLLVVYRYFSCAWSVFGSVILNLRCVCVCVCVCACTVRCQTPTKHTKNICETLRVISVKRSSIIPDDGSHTIRNMLEWFLIVF